MKSKCDHSTKVGGRRNKMGSDVTAGNSVTSPGKRRTFQSSKVTAVAKENKRFSSSKSVRKGRKNSVS
jgi:hypothetical protein